MIVLKATSDKSNFDQKEFGRWWENWKKSEPELDRRIEAALMKARSVILQNKARGVDEA